MGETFLREGLNQKNTIMTTKLKFDLGVYSFHRVLNGALCADDHKAKEGDVLGVLHPLTTIDASNLYCFAIHRESGQVLQLIRKNLRFKRVFQLTCDFNPSSEIETHVKYQEAFKFMCELEKSEQLQIKAA
ncbi:MAG: hypothetical protein ACK52I_02755 [Pseudomonadota bacterium]|jgi:hypothetical protein